MQMFYRAIARTVKRLKGAALVWLTLSTLQALSDPSQSPYSTPVAVLSGADSPQQIEACPC